MSPLDPFLASTHIAYFSMEIALRPEMHTYSGGLGVLSGDTVRSSADLELPMVFVTLACRAGYFLQEITPAGDQVESPDWWRPERWCTALDAMVAVRIGGRPVWVRPWLYVHTSSTGQKIPVILLDTDHDANQAEDRGITNTLYGGGNEYRLRQEVVLGIGGVRILRALEFQVRTFHLNEGHAALLTLELLHERRAAEKALGANDPAHVYAEIRNSCAFTTHTPVEAGHDRFSYETVHGELGDFTDYEELRRLAGNDRLNMTQLALNLCGYVNGVALRHAETSEKMFPGYRVRAVTNGVHVETWAHAAFAKLYGETIPHWQHEPIVLMRILHVPDEAVWNAHQTAKRDLFTEIRARTGVELDPAVPTLGFARRMTGYKRPTLLFSDLERLQAIAGKTPFQVVLAGKAHPHDTDGKNKIRWIHDTIRRLDKNIRCVFLPGYDMEIAKSIVSGCDVWLNTPQPPLEASGTSGMKAALNGALNLSTLDGWWVEACIEGVTGWAIGGDGGDVSDATHAGALYDKLEHVVLPLYYNQPDKWRWMMKQAIAVVPSYFNSQRMMRRYASEAYLR